MNGRSAWLVAWLGIVTTLALPGISLASETLAAKAYTGRAAGLASPSSRSTVALRVGDPVYITANSRSAQGYLRVAIENSGAGFGSPAVLKAPENRGLFPNLRRAQQWKIERNPAVTSSQYASLSFRFRNVYSDKCLTAARDRGAPVYLQYCGNILGQAWSFVPAGGPISSLNYNQTFPAGCPCTTLDITEFRNVVGTPLQVARNTGKWNQIWNVDVVPLALR